MTSPIARPVALMPTTEKPWTDSLSRPIRTAKDLPTSRSSRISRRQLEAIAADLTQRDRDLLAFVAEVRLATGGQLRRRYFATSADGRTARRALERLATWRVLDRLPRTVGGVRAGSRAYIYGLGPTGVRLLAREQRRRRRLDAPGDRYVNHTLAITEVMVELFEAHHLGLLDILERETEPTCWRRFTGPMGARRVLKPDLFLRLGIGAYEDRWFVEIDMATESSSTVLAKANTYLAHYRSGDEQRRHGVYPRVVWATSTLRRAHQITEALGQMPAVARKLFLVCTQEDLIHHLVIEAHE
jgi:hypothetical protein